MGARLGARSCDKDAVIFCIASCGDTGAVYDFGLYSYKENSDFQIDLKL